MTLSDMTKKQLTRLPRYDSRIVQWLFIDSITLILAYLIVFSIRAVSAPLDYGERLGFILLVSVINLIFLYAFGVYRRIWTMTSGHDVSVIVNAMALSTVVNIGFDLLQDQRMLPLSVVLVGGVLALCAVVATRYRSRLVQGASWRWRAIWLNEFPQISIIPVLIVGAGESGQMLAMRLRHRTQKNDKIYQIAGFIDDDPKKQGMYIEGCQILGKRQDIPRLAEKHRIELIIIAIHNIAGADFREILNYCESTNARIKVIPDMLAAMTGQTTAGTLLRDVQPQDLIGRTAISRHENIDLSLVTSKVTLVTGAAGSIGSELCRQLCNFEATKLILLDNNESNLFELHTELGHKYPWVQLVPVLADITLKDVLDDVFATHKPQIVFHAAAYKHVPMLERYPDEAVRVNIGGTRNLIEAACTYGVKRFVLISTDKAVNPSCVMGASKRIGELMLQALAPVGRNQPLFTSVRFGNVLGSRGSVLPIFEQQINSGGPITITHPGMTRYFMSIPEAANLVIHAACLTKGNDIFLLKMGDMIRIVDIAERLIRLRGLRPNVDVKIEFTGVRPGEKLIEELYSESEMLTETVHPGIVQLKSKNTEFDDHAFLDNLDRLMQGEVESNLESMLAVINASMLQPQGFMC